MRIFSTNAFGQGNSFHLVRHNPWGLLNPCHRLSPTFFKSHGQQRYVAHRRMPLINATPEAPELITS